MKRGYRDGHVHVIWGTECWDVELYSLFTWRGAEVHIQQLTVRSDSTKESRKAWHKGGNG